jgi:WD repeat-containing protein 26
VVASDKFISVSKNKALVFKYNQNHFSLDQESYDDPGNLKIDTKDNIIAISLSRDGRYLLCNTSMIKPCIECWDLEAGVQGKCVKKYRGHQQKDYVLRPVFGGAADRFVICGSEDSLVYIWCRESTELLLKLSGHLQIVNSVHWHPSNPTLFVSGSDDSRLKLWGLTEYAQAEFNPTKPKRVE